MEKAIVLFFTAVTSTLLSYVEQSGLTLNQADGIVTFSYHLDEGEYLYKESIAAHGEPESIALIAPPEITPQPRKLYDPKLRRDVMTLHGSGTITYRFSYQPPLPPHSTIFFTYRSNKSPSTQQKIVTLAGESAEQQSHQQPTVIHHTRKPQQPHPSFTSAITTQLTAQLNALYDTISTFQRAVSDRVINTKSTPLRLLLVILLGLLMSFTPCIYPMIPITIGILQASTGSSFIKNFTLAFSYTTGMASMFALLGFLAATGSTQFGALLGNIPFVILLVCFLTYLAGSMLGYYEIVMPQFLASNSPSVRGGSYLSAYIFGALSGTVASPCLSPGLLLLLSIVATIGNPLIGFLLLFAFGMGLGIPLLIVGTFSNSAQILPRAGIWMLEAKKIFGLLLLAMCCYYLSFIMSMGIVWAIATGGLFILGICWIIDISPNDSIWLRRYKGAIGMLLIIGASTAAPQIFKTYALKHTTHTGWHSSYITAHEDALIKKRLILVDFGAAWCTSCTALRTKILDSTVVAEKLSQFVPVYIDCTNPSDPSCASIQTQFEVRGYPMILLIDPENNSVIARWSSELLGRSAQDFAQELEKYSNRYN